MYGRMILGLFNNILFAEEAGVAQSVFLTTDRTAGVRSPVEVKDFSLVSVSKPALEAHPASCPMGTRRPFPGVNRGQGVTLNPHPIYCQGQE
jgi:hypothetical protein